MKLFIAIALTTLLIGCDVDHQRMLLGGPSHWKDSNYPEKDDKGKQSQLICDESGKNNSRGTSSALRRKRGGVL